MDRQIDQLITQECGGKTGKYKDYLKEHNLTDHYQRFALRVSFTWNPCCTTRWRLGSTSPILPKTLTNSSSSYWKVPTMPAPYTCSSATTRARVRSRIGGSKENHAGTAGGLRTEQRRGCHERVHRIGTQ